MIKWRQPVHHLIGKDTQWPPISWLVISLSIEDLGGNVLRGPTEGLSKLSISDDLGHAEVGQAYVSVLVHQYVLQFEVSVDEVFVVEVAQCKGHLHHVELGLLFRELLGICQMLEQLATLYIDTNLLIKFMMK